MDLQVRLPLVFSKNCWYTPTARDIRVASCHAWLNPNYAAYYQTILDLANAGF